jgi:hypothetical protein
LNADTKLFANPFLVFKQKTWLEEHHDKIIEHFDRAFILVAESNLNPGSLQYRKALHLLRFSKSKEFYIGCTARGTSGLGSGDGYAAGGEKKLTFL